MSLKYAMAFAASFPHTSGCMECRKHNYRRPRFFLLLLREEFFIKVKVSCRDKCTVILTNRLQFRRARKIHLFQLPMPQFIHRNEMFHLFETVYCCYFITFCWKNLTNGCQKQSLPAINKLFYNLLQNS